MKNSFLILMVIILNCQVCLPQVIKDSLIMNLDYGFKEGVRTSPPPEGTSWYVNVKINKDSVSNPEYLKKIFNWELLLSDYSPEEKLLHQDYEVELIGLGICYVHEMRFTEWHRFVQERIFYVASPRLGKVFVLNFQNVEFVNWHLFLSYNLRGNMSITKVHYNKKQDKFLVDDVKVFKRSDEDFDDDDD